MKFKKVIAGFMTFVMAVAVFATPLAEYLPIQGDGITASAAGTTDILLESVNVKITNSSDSRVKDALDRIDKQAVASSSIRYSKHSSESVKTVLSYFLYTSKYKVFNGQSLPYVNSNDAYNKNISSSVFTDGNSSYNITVNAGGCLAYGKWVRGNIYKDGVGNEIKINKSDITAAKIKDLLVTNGQAGETLHLNTYIHTIVFISCDDNGFYYIDWSGESSGAYSKARFRYITYENFAKYAKSKTKLTNLGLSNRNTSKNPNSPNPSGGGSTSDNSILKGTPLNLGNEFSAAIQSSDGSKALTVDSNGNVSIQKYVGGANQNWLFTLADGNYYQIKNPATGKCLDVSNGGNTNDTNIQVWTDNDTSSQRFGIYGSKGQYILKVKYSTTHVVDAGGGNNNVHLWAYASNIAAQKFNIFPLFDSVTVESITSTNAVLKSTYHKPSAAKAVKYGAYIAPKDKWSNSSNRKDLSFTPQITNVGSTFRYLSFDLTGEFGYKLTPGTTYNYSFYAVYNVGGTNVTYSSGVYSFTSKGTSPHTHSYGSWSTTTAATCTSAGTQKRSCSCGDVQTQSIPALGHNYVTTIVYPTETSQGYNEHTCSRCGDTYRDNYTDKLEVNVTNIEHFGLKGRAADAIRLKWAKNSTVEGYDLYKKVGSEWKFITSLGADTTEYRISGLSPSTKYSFRIRGYRYSNGGYKYSPSYATATYTTNPSIVKGNFLKGRAADALRLGWNKNTSADGYILEQLIDGSWQRIAKLTKNTITEYRVSGLAAGSVATFRIKAYNMVGKTALYSKYVTVKYRTNPTAVSNLTLKGSAADAVRIGWNINLSADGYIIEQKSGSKWVRVEKITKNSTTQYRKSKLKSNTSYSFRVKAYKMSGKTALYSGYKTITVKTK